MTKYVKVDGLGGAVLEYPYTFRKLQLDNPKVSFPKPIKGQEPNSDRLAEWNVFHVTETSKPAYDLTKNIEEGSPVWDGSKYVQTWSEVDASAEEVAERTKKEQREVDRQSTKEDAFVQNFVGMSRSELQSHLDGLNTNAKIKTHVERLTKMIHILAREAFE